MKRVATFVDVKAPAARVWDILTDFPTHPQWNPFITAISGPLSVGAKLVVHITPPGGKGMRFTPKVLVADPERELRWRGRVGVPGLFDGEHYFRLEPTDTGTRFHHGEDFSGLLVALTPKSSIEAIQDGFRAMNEALKTRAEGMNPTARRS